MAERYFHKKIDHKTGAVKSIEIGREGLQRYAISLDREDLRRLISLINGDLTFFNGEFFLTRLDEIDV